MGDVGGACGLCEPGSFCPGGEVSVRCRLFSFSAPGASQEAQCSCVSGYYSTNATAPCLKCLPGAWCAGGLGYVPCSNASTMSLRAISRSAVCLAVSSLLYERRAISSRANMPG